MLKLGGYINILIAIGYLIGLFWAERMFEVAGIGNEMKELTQIHFLPNLLTLFVASVFFVFGLYELSADNTVRKLPFINSVIFLIAGIYIIRGLGELIFDSIQGTNTSSEILYSLIALTIGLLFLIGGLKNRKLTMKKE